MECPKTHYVIDKNCIPFSSSGDEYICPTDYFLQSDDELNRCVKQCKNGLWHSNGLCTDVGECKDPMSYRSEISKRCIPCYVKNSASQTDKC